MLDTGFHRADPPDREFLPARRQNLFFSATMPGDRKLTGEILEPQPLKVSAAPQATTVERINQKVLFVEQQRKRAAGESVFDLSELLSDRLHLHQRAYCVARGWSRWASRRPPFTATRARQRGAARVTRAPGLATTLPRDRHRMCMWCSTSCRDVPEAYVHASRALAPTARPSPSAPTTRWATC